MNRAEELATKIDKMNAKGGLSDEQWNLLLLTDMAKSLAMIVDVLSKNERNENV